MLVYGADRAITPQTTLVTPAEPTPTRERAKGSLLLSASSAGKLLFAHVTGINYIIPFITSIPHTHRHTYAHSYTHAAATHHFHQHHFPHKDHVTLFSFGSFLSSQPQRPKTQARGRCFGFCERGIESALERLLLCLSKLPTEGQPGYRVEHNLTFAPLSSFLPFVP